MTVHRKTVRLFRAVFKIVTRLILGIDGFNLNPTRKQSLQQ